MSDWNNFVSAEAVQRARSAGWAVTAYAVSGLLLLLTVPSGSALVVLTLPAAAATWVWCLVASLRVLVHARENQHSRGRGAALFGMFLTTGCVGLIVSMVLVPPTEV